MTGKADLHTHSFYSDGAYSPYELIQKAHGVGITALSITDHDSVSAIEEATSIGKEFGIAIIPGIELSASFYDREIHILGYFFDYQNEALLSSIERSRENRLERAERIVSKLNKMNIPLSIDDVLKRAGDAAVGRVHIANAMVQEGHAQNYYQVFNKYIGDGCPAYERKLDLSPIEAMQLIAGAGGLSFLAHAGKAKDEHRLVELIKCGLDGIEVIHPSHTADLTKYYRKIVHEYFLLESGGSDVHGGLKGDDRNLGVYTLPMEHVEAMRNRLFQNKHRM